MLAEYANLTHQQDRRIDRRDQLIGATVALAALAWPIAPLVAAGLLLCGGQIHVRNDRHITHIGRYLAARERTLRRDMPARRPLLAWEVGFRKLMPGRLRGKMAECLMQLIVFALAPLGVAVWVLLATPAQHEVIGAWAVALFSVWMVFEVVITVFDLGWRNG